MKIRVENRTRHGYHRYPNPDGDGSYDYGDEYTDNNVCRLTAIDSDRGWYDFETNLDAKIGDHVWFVYAVYSTGSTFGTAEGQITYIDIFHNKQEAEDLVRKVNEFKLDRAAKKWHFDYTNNGKTESCRVCWIGYFERLQYAECQLFEIEAEK